MACDALLIDQQQHCIAVAIEAEFAQQLDLPRSLTFSPELGARPRPIAGAALVEAGPHRLAVHPGQHQDLAGIVLLSDGRHETVGAKPDRGHRIFDPILHLLRPFFGCPCHITGLGWQCSESNTGPAGSKALRLDDLILETRGLTKEFGGFAAVQAVDLKVRRGTIHALISPNGVGKTTVFNLLTKFLEPTTGRIFSEYSSRHGRT
jgi:ABC-type glutathione transport system ATPase component